MAPTGVAPEEIQEGAGTRLDPRIVEVLLRLIGELADPRASSASLGRTASGCRDDRRASQRGGFDGRPVSFLENPHHGFGRDRPTPVTSPHPSSRGFLCTPTRELYSEHGAYPRGPQVTA